MPIFKIKVEFEVEIDADTQEEAIEAAKTGLFLPNTISKKKVKK